VKGEGGRGKGAPAEALQEVIALVREVAREEITPRYLRVAHTHKNDGSLFTEADEATQKALVSALPGIIQSPVLGEEMTETEQRAAWAGGDNGLWCIDPIDGTSNFVAGIPYFAISVAWLRNGRRELGVVYDPVANECFYAARGQGAFLDSEPLPIRAPVSELRRAMGGIEPKRLTQGVDRQAGGRSSLCLVAQLRRLGARLVLYRSRPLRPLCARQAKIVGLRGRRPDPGRGRRTAGVPGGRFRRG